MHCDEVQRRQVATLADELLSVRADLWAEDLDAEVERGVDLTGCGTRCRVRDPHLNKIIRSVRMYE